MGWLHLNHTDSKVFQEAIREIDTMASERAVCVVAAAFVEDHLTTYLKSRMQKDEAGTVIRDAFQPTGALGNFGTKVDLGFFMGCYSEKARKELQTIVKLRNDFAHKLSVNTFNDESVKARCKNLEIWDAVKIKVVNRKLEGSPASLDLRLGGEIGPEEQHLPIIDLVELQGPITAQKQYVSACKFYIAAFAVLTNMPTFDFKWSF